MTKVMDVIKCYGLMVFGKSAQAPQTGQGQWERGEEHPSLEVRPVLLQFGVVHVDCEKLKTQTHIVNEKGDMNFEAR